MKVPMTIRHITETSTARSARWMGEETWSTLEWAGAMCGEAGEAANAAKKLKRLEQGFKSINAPGRDYKTLHEARKAVAKEVCDTILYAVLVATSAGLNGYELEETMAEVFNLKSEEYGFPERLIAND